MRRLNAIERYKRRRARRLDARGIRLDADWNENDHPRAENGQFTSGGGGSGSNDNGENKPIRYKAPKVKEGSSRSSTIAECAKGAIKDGFRMEYNNVVKNMKKDDIVYQKNSKGQTIGSVPGLAAKVDNKVQFKDRPAKSKEVQAIYDGIRDSEKKITSDMIGMSDDIGCCMSGLEFSMKSGSHFAEKIDRVREKRLARDPNYNASDEEIAKGITDCVRYTMMTDHNNMVDNAKKAISELEKRGYKVSKVENRFYPKEEGREVDYKGIHLDVTSPNGQTFEFQIHSDDTMKVKNMNHKIYEMTEGKDGVERTEEEKAKLFRKMVKNASKISDPPGIFDFYPPDFAKKKK